MGRVERKLFRIADDVQRLVEERNQLTEELQYHRHIDDDVQRDAVVSGSNMDRLEASATAADVRRFERRLRDIETRLGKLEAKRQTLLAKLD